ncbi:START domain protein [Teladorsagia circumcincta]|uniref:START domain protein n=1 Tax=Teladorsagia circumcincta TaxID=45464 RepID=A0A2G9UEJ1_TELCI|nr:START domain protein [Teladorsagia circumcincta]
MNNVAPSHYISDDEFRSAMEFSSDDEAFHGLSNRPLRVRGGQIPIETRQKYEKALSDASEKVEYSLRQARMGEWKVLKVKEPMVLQAPDLSYFIRSDFSCSPQVLFDAAWRDVLRWNTQLVEARIIATIDPVTDLYYSMSAPALKGYVSSRGSNGPSCIRAIGDATSGRSYLEWIMHTDLKGGLPKRLVQSTMLTYFIDHVTRLREYIDRQSVVPATS